MNLVEFFNEKNLYTQIKNNFMHACKSHGGIFKIFCKDTKNNDIFYCKHDVADKKPRIVLVSGLHGDEPGGPLGLFDFYQKCDVNKANFLLLPILNPYGFYKSTRKDDMRRDLNRAWDKNDRQMVIKSKKLLLQFRPNVLFSLHEDKNVDGFYLYPSANFSQALCRLICKKIGKYINPITDGEIYGDRVENGIVSSPNVQKPKHAKSLEYFFEKKDIPNITIEIPANIDLGIRKKIYSSLLGSLFDEKYYQQGHSDA
jgi:hypothetical protein